MLNMYKVDENLEEEVTSAIFLRKEGTSGPPQRLHLASRTLVLLQAYLGPMITIFTLR